LVGGAGVVVAMLSFVVALEAQFARARSDIDPMTVNRALKGDRLPIIPGPRGENPAGQPRLPDGCEPRFSSVRNIYTNEVAGRCVAAGPMLEPISSRASRSSA